MQQGFNFGPPPEEIEDDEVQGNLKLYEADPILAARTKWLRALTGVLEPEYHKRGLHYPEDMNVYAGLFVPDPMHQLIDLLNGRVSLVAGETLRAPKNIKTLVKHIENHPDDQEFLQRIDCQVRNEDPVNLRTRVRVIGSAADPFFPGGTLIHELVHACLPVKEEHGPLFEAHCRSFGLEGVPDYMNSGREATKLLTGLFTQIPPYPYEGVGASYWKGDEPR